MSDSTDVPWFKRSRKVPDGQIPSTDTEFMNLVREKGLENQFYEDFGRSMEDYLDEYYDPQEPTILLNLCTDLGINLGLLGMVDWYQGHWWYVK